MKEKLTEQNSLELIEEMIMQTRGNIQKGAANVMLFSGYSVAIIALLNIILIYVLDKPYYSFWIWLLMIPVSMINCMIRNKREKIVVVKTHIDKIVSQIWFAFLISTVIFLVAIFSFVFVFNVWKLTILITPTILIMLGLAQYATAVATRFIPFMRGAYVFWVGAVLCPVSYFLINIDIQFIVLAICMLVGFVIPGYILNRKAEENV